MSTKQIENLVTDLDCSIAPFFTSQEIDELAREAGFVRRKGKLNGRRFLDLIVFNSENLKSQSLNDWSVILKNEHHVDITKQSLHDRFNKYAVTFLRNALEKLIRTQLDVKPYLLKLEGINRILIKDSVCFQIHESLATDYPGSGGAGSKVSVRIQFEYDLLCGKINELSLNAFNDQDATNSVATVDLLSAGDLIVRDLAYVGLAALKAIMEKLAFFLCRLSPGVKVYELNGNQYTELDFSLIRRYMEKGGLAMMEKEAYLGKQQKLKARLVIHLMPADEVEKRIRRARQHNKKKGRNALT